MEKIPVYLETGKKRVFAGAVEWPGWCRAGRDEAAALTALFEYAPRYARALSKSGLSFKLPSTVEDFEITARLEGTTTTDFGSPAVAPHEDSRPVDADDLGRFQALLEACWTAFDAAAEKAAGKELRKGPRGGGRDLEQIVEHTLEAEKAYLRKIAFKPWDNSEKSFSNQLRIERQETLQALETAINEGLPESGPRGGKLWSVRYFVRRAAWHILDHAWEIEDRIP